MKKFSIKWENFQTAVSSSFSKLRNEEDFYDVTLVTDDEQYIEAHKVVLASSSQFFKKILKMTKITNPLIYLSGIKYAELSLIIDYIYTGEVQLYEEDVDSFFKSAQKLKVEGLSNGNVDSEEYPPSSDELKEEISNEEESQQEENPNEDDELKEATKQTEVKDKVFKRSKNYVQLSSQAEKAIDEMIVEGDGQWKCKICEKTAEQKFYLKYHVEKHLEGLKFDCPLCDQSFRTRQILANHKFKNHKN